MLARFFKNIQLLSLSLDLDTLQIYLISFLIFFLIIPFPYFIPIIPFKTFLISLFIFISLILFFIKFTQNQVLNLPKSFSLLFFTIFLILAIFSTILSSSKYFSFYSNISSSHSLISFLLYFLIFLILLINLNASKILEKLYLLILASLLGTLINNILILISLFIPLPYFVFTNFTEMIILSTFSFLLSSSIFIQNLKIDPSKKFLNITLKTLTLLNLILSSVILFISNFQLIWLILALLFSGIYIYNSLYEKEEFKVNAIYLILTTFFLLLYIISPELGIFIFSRFPNLPQEIRPNFLTSLNISYQTFKTNPLLGTGPSTFIYSWLKFRPPGLNLLNLETTRFDQSFNLPLTLITETGLLGFVIFLIFVFYLLLIFLFYLSDIRLKILQLPSLFLIAAIFFFPSYIIHLSLLFIFSSMLLISLTDYFAIKIQTKKLFLALIIMLLIGTFFYIIMFYNITKYLIASIFYLKSLNELQNNNFDKAINYLNISNILAPKSDLYLRELSSLLLQRANIEVRTQNPNIQFIQNLITYSIQTSNLAISINPLEPLNYFTLANIYENLSSANQQFYYLAIENYQKAAERDPYNPVYYVRMAILHYNNKNKIKGDENLKKAYMLKPTDQQILNLIRNYMVK